MSETFVKTTIRNLVWHSLGVALFVLIVYFAKGDVWIAFKAGVGYNMIRWAVHVPYDRACFKLWRWIDDRRN